MRDLPRRIMEHASTLQEGTPLCARALLHLGNRTAVDQALSRLARSGKLMRIFQGVYLHPVKTRFGIRAPRLEAVLGALSGLWGEIIVPSGGATANFLGLIPQNPIRPVYLTSGPNRELHFGKNIVELRHAPRSHLTAPHTKTGDIIRALLWLGPEGIEDHLEKLWPTLSRKDLDELATARSTMPNWMAESVSVRLKNA